MPRSIIDAAADPRDYYVAEDDGGRRFWLFREGLYGDRDEPRWYPARVLRMSQLSLDIRQRDADLPLRRPMPS